MQYQIIFCVYVLEIRFICKKCSANDLTNLKQINKCDTFLVFVFLLLIELPTKLTLYWLTLGLSSSLTYI